MIWPVATEEQVRQVVYRLLQRHFATSIDYLRPDQIIQMTSLTPTQVHLALDQLYRANQIDGLTGGGVSWPLLIIGVHPS